MRTPAKYLYLMATVGAQSGNRYAAGVSLFQRFLFLHYLGVMGRVFCPDIDFIHGMSPHQDGYRPKRRGPASSPGPRGRGI